jgi:hypothetical protein
MKINVYALITVAIISTLLSFASTIDPASAENAAKNKGKPIVLEQKTLKNPIRLYNTPQEGVMTAKVRYVIHTPLNTNMEAPQNVFDYKVFQMSDEHMIIYNADQSLTKFDDSTLNSKFYLMTVKYENIDLLCGDKFFLCTLGEFKREFEKKLKYVDFKTNPLVTAVYPEAIARDNCIIFTIGVFKSLNDVAYMCFDDREDTIFFLDLLSERILKRYKGDYDGQIRLVNQVKF